MLKSITIKRFRSLHEQTIRFGRGNLFIGSNGAGKSNALEALGVLAAALSNGIDPVTLGNKGVRLSLPSLFKSAFKNYDLPKTFRIEAHFDFGRYEFSVRAGQSSSFLEFFSEALYEGDRKVFGRSQHGISLDGSGTPKGLLAQINLSGIEPSRSIVSALYPLLNIGEQFRSEIDSFANFAIYAPQTAVMRGLAVDNRAIEPLGLTGSGLATAFNYMQLNLSKSDMSQIADIIWKTGWTNRIQTGPIDTKIIPAHIATAGGVSIYYRDSYMHTERNELSPFDASEGSLYLTFVAALMGHPDAPNSFALDNVDGTLNPRMVRLLTNYVLEMMVSDIFDSKKQVFLTSHHPSALDSFDIFNDDHAVFVCHRASHKEKIAGETIVDRLLPPGSVTKEAWNVAHGAEKLSTLFLKERIPDAL